MKRHYITAVSPWNFAAYGEEGFETEPVSDLVVFLTASWSEVNEYLIERHHISRSNESGHFEVFDRANFRELVAWAQKSNVLV